MLRLGEPAPSLLETPDASWPFHVLLGGHSVPRCHCVAMPPPLVAMAPAGTHWPRGAAAGVCAVGAALSMGRRVKMSGVAPSDSTPPCWQLKPRQQHVSNERSAAHCPAWCLLPWDVDAWCGTAASTGLGTRPWCLSPGAERPPCSPRAGSTASSRRRTRRRSGRGCRRRSWAARRMCWWLRSLASSSCWR